MNLIMSSKLQNRTDHTWCPCQASWDLWTRVRGIFLLHFISHDFIFCREWKLRLHYYSFSLYCLLCKNIFSGNEFLLSTSCLRVQKKFSTWVWFHSPKKKKKNFDLTEWKAQKTFTQNNRKSFSLENHFPWEMLHTDILLMFKDEINLQRVLDRLYSWCSGLQSIYSVCCCLHTLKHNHLQKIFVCISHIPLVYCMVVSHGALDDILVILTIQEVWPSMGGSALVPFSWKDNPNCLSDWIETKQLLNF